MTTIYTKPVAGTAQKITVTGTAQTLAGMGVNIDDDTNLVTLYPVDQPSGVNELAWYSNDPNHTLAVDDGISYFAFQPIEITKAQFAGFKIIIDSGADKVFFVQQFDSESFSS